jgi:hypothetical protein
VGYTLEKLPFAEAAETNIDRKIQRALVTFGNVS